jgi:hypothetical protein
MQLFSYHLRSTTASRALMSTECSLYLAQFMKLPDLKIMLRQIPDK